MTVQVKPIETKTTTAATEPTFTPLRWIGIRHCVKRTAQNEARPTQVYIFENDTALTYEMEDEEAELGFALGCFPTSWRPVTAGEDISGFKPHHVKWKKADKKGDAPLPDKVPASYDGLKASDLVATIMGGSGDYFIFALARKGKKIGAQVIRIPPIRLKAERGESGEKDDDSMLLAQLAQTKPELFYPVNVREGEMILIRINQQARADAMKARIACEQRLYQRSIGEIFCSPDGGFPEGSVEDFVKERKASDATLAALIKEENRQIKKLETALNAFVVYQKILKPIEGMGPAIAGRLLACIQDVRRFGTVEKFKHFCGVHVQADGTFPRSRVGQGRSWNNEARGALYNFWDQMNRRPNSEWGERLTLRKQREREKHPYAVLQTEHGDFELIPGKFKEKAVASLTDEERGWAPGELKGKKAWVIETINGSTIVVSGGTRKFTDGHIHKRARWAVLQEFVEWLYKEWWALETKLAAEEKSAGGSATTPPEILPPNMP